MSSNCEDSPPERVQVSDRPAPEVEVAVETEPAGSLEEPKELREPARLDERSRRLPDDVAQWQPRLAAFVG